jgi:hypothetical protein
VPWEAVAAQLHVQGSDAPAGHLMVSQGKEPGSAVQHGGIVTVALLVLHEVCVLLQAVCSFRYCC